MNLQELKLPQLDGGLNLRDLEYKIDDTQSPDMLNMWNRDGVLSKRWGQSLVDLYTTTDTTSTAYTSVTLGAIYSISPEFENYVAVHSGTKLYKWDTANNVMTDLGVSVAASASVFLEFNSLLYHLDGTEIRQISSAYSCTTVVPYVPTVFINCKPNLSESDANEDFNLIGAGFKVWYDGDGASTAYTLPVAVLDSTAVSITVDGVALAENTKFTVNRTAGTINFAAGSSPHGAPAATAPNNVVITAYKTVTGSKAKIAGCNVAIAFGGESTDIAGGTRAFLMKNASYPRTYWYSALGNAQGPGMTYFPDTQYEELIQNNEAITAAGKQSGELIIFKKNSIFAISYNFDGQDVYYPVREFNSSIGCDMPKSVQLIDNNLVFGNTKYGVMMVISTTGTAEENIKPVSGNINGTKLKPGLLQETAANLLHATAIDYDRKYWLRTGDKVWLWDYGVSPFYGYSNYEKAQRRLAWYKFDNINASAWYGNATSLFYAYSTASIKRIVRFSNNFADFGEAIIAYWRSKAFDFKMPDELKTITKIWPSIRVDTSSSVLMEVSNEKKETVFSKELVVSNFSWNGANWATMSWNVQKYAKPFKTKPKMKKVVYCQIKFSNDENFRDMGVTDLVIEYFSNGKVKR